MFGLDINIWAVLVAAVAGMVVGAAWYSASLFGPIFRAEVAKLGTQGGDMQKSIMISAVTQVVTAQLSLGIVVPFAVKCAPFEGRSWTLVALNTGEHVLSMASMGAILGAWR